MKDAKSVRLSLHPATVSARAGRLLFCHPSLLEGGGGKGAEAQRERQRWGGGVEEEFREGCTARGGLGQQCASLDLLKNNRLLNFLAPQVFSHCCGAQK